METLFFKKKEKQHEPNMDKLYMLLHDEKIKDPLTIITEEETFICTVAWEQGSGNNYRFVKGDTTCGYAQSDIIWPDEVLEVYIEYK